MRRLSVREKGSEGRDEGRGWRGNGGRNVGRPASDFFSWDATRCSSV